MKINSTRVVAKVALLTEDGKILLLRRSKTDTRRPLQWDLPGGMVDPGEGYFEAACRETAEEAGINISLSDLTLGYTMADMTEKGNVCWLFFVAKVSAELPVIISHEHSEHTWAPLEEAMKYILYERQQRALKHIQKYVALAD